MYNLTVNLTRTKRDKKSIKCSQAGEKTVRPEHRGTTCPIVEEKGTSSTNEMTDVKTARRADSQCRCDPQRPIWNIMKHVTTRA